jgi:signal transduction histidine kinase
MLDAALLLNSTLEPKELTGIILEIVREQVPVERVSVFVVDRQSNLVRSLVAQEVEREIALPIGSGIAGTVAATGEIIDILDAYADSRFDSSFDAELEFQTRDLLAMPIVNRKGTVCGVLELLNRKKSIVSEDLEYLRAMSIYIGLALENAFLYQQALNSESLKKDLVRLRDRLARMERLSTMAQVLACVGHEINNPLAVAMGNAGLLGLRLPPDSECRHYIDTIESNIARAASVIRKYVNFVETQTREHQATAPGELLRRIIRLRSWEWKFLGIEAVVDIEPAPPVYGNEDQLQLIFMHLIMNAEHAAVKGEPPRSIAIRLRHVPLRQRVLVEIVDSGPGITPDQARFFEPLFTAGGDEAGLATVRSIVERHEGRVWYDTAAEGGTTFIIEFPAFVDSGVTSPI